MDHTSRNDAAGADAGDGAAPAARLIEAVPCPSDDGAMDIVSSTDPSHTIQIHFSAAEWAEFVAAVKAGRYDGAGG